MKIKMISARVVGKKPRKAGATVDADDKEAKFLIASGKAEKVEGKEKEDNDKAAK
jgi:hypothetical protein